MKVKQRWKNLRSKALPTLLVGWFRLATSFQIRSPKAVLPKRGQQLLWVMGVNTKLEKCPHYLSVLGGNLKGQGKPIGIEAIIQGDESSMDTRFNEIVCIVLKERIVMLLKSVSN